MGPFPQLRMEDGSLGGQSLKVATIDKQKFCPQSFALGASLKRETFLLGSDPFSVTGTLPLWSRVSVKAGRRPQWGESPP